MGPIPLFWLAASTDTTGAIPLPSHAGPSSIARGAEDILSAFLMTVRAGLSHSVQPSRSRTAGLGAAADRFSQREKVLDFNI